MNNLSLTAIGRDRPGIVAAVTGVLLEHGCNLADCSMTLLGGQFAMIILLQAPDDLSPESLTAGLGEVEGALGLTVHVHPVADLPQAPSGRPYVISVFGADHPGIVYRVAAELASRGVNVTDLMSRVVGGVYTIVLDVELPQDLDEGSLEQALSAMAAEVGVDLTLRPAEVDSL